LVAVGVAEDSKGAPGLFGGGRVELDFVGDEFLEGALNVIAIEGCRIEGADAIGMVLRGEEYDLGLGSGNRQLDPTLGSVEGLIRGDSESQFFGVEGKSAVLVCHGNADEFYAFDHARRISNSSGFVNRFSVTILLMPIVLDDYVVTVLMRDLVGHDRIPSAFLVYLHLWGESNRQSKASVRASHQMMAEATGLSKSAVQKGIRCLVGRQLLRCRKDSATAIPEYRVLRPWRR